MVLVSFLYSLLALFLFVVVAPVVIIVAASDDGRVGCWRYVKIETTNGTLMIVYSQGSIPDFFFSEGEGVYNSCQGWGLELAPYPEMWIAILDKKNGWNYSTWEFPFTTPNLQNWTESPYCPGTKNVLNLWFHVCPTTVFCTDGATQTSQPYLYHIFIVIDVFLPCPDSLLVNLKEYKEVREYPCNEVSELYVSARL